MAQGSWSHHRVSYGRDALNCSSNSWEWRGKEAVTKEVMEAYIGFSLERRLHVHRVSAGKARKSKTTRISSYEEREMTVGRREIDTVTRNNDEMYQKRRDKHETIRIKSVKKREKRKGS